MRFPPSELDLFNLFGSHFQHLRHPFARKEILAALAPDLGDADYFFLIYKRSVGQQESSCAQYTGAGASLPGSPQRGESECATPSPDELQSPRKKEVSVQLVYEKINSGDVFLQSEAL